MDIQVIGLNNVDNSVFNDVDNELLNKKVGTLILNGVEIWKGFLKLDELIDRSIESVSAEDLEGVTSIEDSAFRGCESLTEITIPDSVTTIKNNSFYGCTSLREITIPNSVTTIGSNVFENNTSLTNVIIGSGVVSTGYAVFLGCTSLTTLRLLPIEPPTLSSGADIGIPDSTTRIEVPIGSLSAYQSADMWSKYADRMVGV